MPDDAKISFANGPFGKMVASMMESEQTLLGDWKIRKIVEAAEGDDDSFDADFWHERLLEVLDKSHVTLFSFVDCPWCLLVKKLLRDEYNLVDSDGGALQIIELEDLDRDGKKLRAAIALATGRTSMPACFLGGKSIGGYTDGFALNANDVDVGEGTSGFTHVPAPGRDLRSVGSPGLAALHDRGELAVLLLLGDA